MEVLGLKEPIESDRQSGRVGRPSEFIPERRTAILEAIKLGMPEGRAAELCGLDPSTLAHWKARGRKEESGPFSDFLRDLQEADAQCEFALLAKVRKATEEPKHWSAAMALLERKWPNRWSKADRTAGLTSEGILQHHLIKRQANGLLKELQTEKDRIEYELDRIEKGRYFASLEARDLEKKRLEGEKGRIQARVELLS